mgnify:CR=1 FL=1
MSICPKNKSSKARRDKRRANWKMAAPNLVKCSKCGALMMQSLWFLQQERNRFSGSLIQAIKNRSVRVCFFVALHINNHPVDQF